MALRTRVWSAGKLVLLGGGLVVTYLIFAAASMRIALRSREVQVPDFTNRTAKRAPRSRPQSIKSRKSASESRK